MTANIRFMNRCDLVILGCLYERDQHGYDIKSFVEDRELNRWANISVSTIYHRLGWLSKNGYIENTGASEEKPQRTEFRLTESGKALLEQEVQDFICGFSDDPRTLGLAYLHVLPPSIAVAKLQSHIDDLENEVKHMKRIIRRGKNEDNLNPLSPLLNNMSLEHIRVELKYMKAARDILSDDRAAKRIQHFFDINL